MRFPSEFALIAVVAVGLVFGVPLPAHAQRVELRVLLVTTGDRGEDPTSAMMIDLMDNMGVAYEVLDSSVRELSDVVLEANGVGRFNGVILTDSQTYIASEARVGFSQQEFLSLQDYEQRYRVAESVMSGWPVSGDGVVPDYGMIPESITGAGGVEGEWTGPAGGRDMFEYVRVERTLPTSEWAFPAIGRPQQGSSPIVEPVLVDSAARDYGIVFELSYPTGRHVLLSTVNNPWWSIHAQVLAYEFLNYATSGLFLGGRYAYLSAHVDDLFLESEVWNPDANANFSEDVRTYRLNGSAISNYLQQEKSFRTRHPLAPGFRVEWAFNGSGANTSRSSNDSLTNTVKKNKGNMRFINHTFSHVNMTKPCLDTEGVTPVTADCPVTDYATAYGEIANNRTVWASLGLPDRSTNDPVLVSGGHSGLSDLPNASGVPQAFPDGLNPNFLNAATALGVRTFAADVSRPNQGKIQRIPGYNAIILPRYPTAIFYNATTPAEDTDEYNYIHHERYLAMGIDPCLVPEAICTPRTYEGILAAEADTTLRQMLSYRPFAHYFHQNNLHPYAGAATLQFDWLETVMKQYERYMDLPVRNLLFRDLGTEAWRRVVAAEAQPTATYDWSTNLVTLRANKAANVRITGVALGPVYGGQRIADVATTVVPVALVVDRGYSL